MRIPLKDFPWPIVIAAAVLLQGADARDVPGRAWELRRGGSIVRPYLGGELRVLSWNIERGVQFRPVLEHLENARADLILLQEVDWEARRSGGRRIAQELGETLGMEWIFAPEFLELGQRVDGRDAWHGQATLARLAVRGARVIRFRSQTASWRPKTWLPGWAVFQPREGGRIALVTEHEAAGVPVVAYNLHLESREGEQLRIAQIREVLEDVRNQPRNAVVLIAGDFNTKTGAGSPVIREVEAAGFRRAAGGEVTTKRGQALDWIFVRGARGLAGGRVRPDVRPSDHYPVEAAVRLPAPGGL